MIAFESLNHYSQACRPLLRWAVRIFTPLAILALIWAAWHGRNSLSLIIEESRPLLLAAGIGLWLLLHFIAPLFTVLVFRGCRQSLAYREAFLIHAGRLPAKYLPGGIWHTVARAADYHGRGIGRRQLAAYLLIENLVAAAATLAIGGVMVVGLRGVDAEWRSMAGLLALAGLVTLPMLPWLVNRHLLPLDGGLARRPYYQGLACVIANWSLAGAAFALYLAAFPELKLTASLFEAAGIYIFAWGVGFITLFAPQGIGVSEFVAAQLLSGKHALGTLAALLAGFRLLILFADLAAWALSLLLGAFPVFKRFSLNSHQERH